MTKTADRVVATAQDPQWPSLEWRLTDDGELMAFQPRLGGGELYGYQIIVTPARLALFNQLHRILLQPEKR